MHSRPGVLFLCGGCCPPEKGAVPPAKGAVTLRRVLGACGVRAQSSTERERRAPEGEAPGTAGKGPLLVRMAPPRELRSHWLKEWPGE